MALPSSPRPAVRPRRGEAEEDAPPPAAPGPMPSAAARAVFPTLLLSLPLAGVLAALVVWADLPPGLAVLGFAVAFVLTGLVVRSYVYDVLVVSRFARDLALGRDSRTPELTFSPLAEDLASSVAQLGRSWRQRNRELESLVMSSEIVLDSLPDPLIFLGDNRRITGANLAARQLFRRELKGLDLATVLRDPYILEEVQQVLDGEPGAELPISTPMPDEREFRARMESLPMTTPEGSRMVMALHDVTTIHRMEQMRADFVANASHELRTPLSALLGYIETLQGPARDDTDARDRFLAIMHEQASRMARLIHDLMSLSMIELNEHTKPKGAADLNRILGSVGNALEVTAKAKGMGIAVSVPADLPPAAGKTDELTQVFQNLVDNAIKYGRAATVVEVSARIETAIPLALRRLEPVPKRMLAVTVRDHGEGIPKEHIPRLTERFYRVDAARSRALGGTGLGLAIVKHIINRHRGHLAIESEIGKGSAFTVFLHEGDDIPSPEDDDGFD